MRALTVLPAPTIWCEAHGLVFEGAVEGPPVTIADLGAIEHEHHVLHLEEEMRALRALEGVR